VTTFETLVGNPSNQVSKNHNTEASARTRIVNAMTNMREFGGRYHLDLQRECTSVIQQIKNTNLKVLPVGEWRRWEVQEPYSDVTLRVAVRRTS
jgi:hypothetical protein